VVIRKDSEMKENLKTMIMVVLIISITSIAVGYISSTNQSDDKITTVDSITKQEYIDAIKQKGGDGYVVCIYDRLIDKIGVKAVYKLDAQILADKANADKYITPELTEVMGQCASEKL